MQGESTPIDQNEHSAEVDLEKGTCSCSYGREFAELPCRHMFKVFAQDAARGEQLFAKIKISQFWLN